MSLREDTLRTVTDYWAHSLGCDPEAFAGTGTTVVAAPETDPIDFVARIGADEVQIIVRGDAVVVSVPADRLEGVRESVADANRVDFTDDRSVAGWLGQPVSQVLGPAFLGYADAETVRAVPETGVRRLDAGDVAALTRLKGACPDQEWERSVAGVDPGSERPVVGRFVDGELVALASYDVWDELLAQIGVLTHPARREKGHGTAVVSRVAALALERGFLPQYRTLERWPSSVGLARSVGFERYGRSVLVVLETTAKD